MIESDISKDIMYIFMQMGYVVGIPDIIMKIYSIIWMSDEPISQNEIQEILKQENISLGKTVISLTLKDLLNLGGIEKVKKSNDRTNYYIPKSESLIEIFQLSMSKILGPAELRIKNFTNKYKNHKLGKKLINEVDKLHSFLKHIISMDYSEFET